MLEIRDAMAPGASDSPSPAEDAEGVAQRLADAEGLTLVRADNHTGYRYVSVDQRKLNTAARKHNTPYRARSVGHSFNLGEFHTAHEAALAIARHLGPKLSQEQASGYIPSRNQLHSRGSEFGVPRKRSLDTTYDQAATVIECCTVTEAESSDGDGSDGSGARTAIHAELVAVSTVGGAAASQVEEGGGTAAHGRKRPAVRPSRTTGTTWTTRHEKPVVTVVDGVAYFAVEVPAGARAPVCLTAEWAS